MKWHSIETPEGERRVATVKTPKGVWVSYRGRSYFVQNESATAGQVQGDDQVVAPMTGKIIEISTAEGAEVKAGDIVVTMEAMKMEYRVESPRDGVVEKVLVAAEELVDQLRVRARPLLGELREAVGCWRRRAQVNMSEEGASGVFTSRK